MRRFLQQLTDRIADVEEKSRTSHPAYPDSNLSDEDLALVAAAIYRARRRRAKHFDAAVFSEPAWDMLLELFVCMVRAQPVSTKSLCLAAEVPQATGIRWIRLLEQNELVRRFRAPDDKRLSLVEISPKAFRLIRSYLSEGLGKFDVPNPFFKE